MTCPDCDPVAFRAALVAKYGEPLRMGDTDYFASPDMPERYTMDPGRWARSICPIHATTEPNKP